MRRLHFSKWPEERGFAVLLGMRIYNIVQYNTGSIIICLCTEICLLSRKSYKNRRLPAVINFLACKGDSALWQVSIETQVSILSCAGV